MYWITQESRDISHCDCFCILGEKPWLGINSTTLHSVSCSVIFVSQMAVVKFRPGKVVQVLQVRPGSHQAITTSPFSVNDFTNLPSVGFREDGWDRSLTMTVWHWQSCHGQHRHCFLMTQFDQVSISKFVTSLTENREVEMDWCEHGLRDREPTRALIT